MDFLGCHIKNTPLTISPKNIQRRYQSPTEFMIKHYFPHGVISFTVISNLSPLNGRNPEVGGFSISYV